MYSGGADGVVRMWDIVTGEMLYELGHHQALVRDCSWAPFEPRLTTVSWDGSVVEWGPGDSREASLLSPSDSDRFDAFV